MDYLADTNIVSRSIVTTDPQHSLIATALQALADRGDRICITSQVLIEFRAIATRPVESNGLGMDASKVAIEIKKLENTFHFFEDAPAIYTRWSELVNKYGVLGKQVHDARLVAVMQVYGVSHLLTLNAKHFARYTEITVVEPGSLPPPQ